MTVDFLRLMSHETFVAVCNSVAETFVHIVASLAVVK